MEASGLKTKWRKDREKDTIREMNMDDNRLNDKCRYRIQYEPYSWCDLSENICLEDTGNSDFDTGCENNTPIEEKK